MGQRVQYEVNHDGMDADDGSGLALVRNGLSELRYLDPHGPEATAIQWAVHALRPDTEPEIAERAILDFALMVADHMGLGQPPAATQ